MAFDTVFTGSGADAGERLHQAIQMAGRAATDWENRGMVDAALTIACATPNSAHVISAQGWPLVPEGDYDRGVMVAGLVELIETPASDRNCTVICAAISVLLGLDGCRAFLEDARDSPARRDSGHAVLCR